MSHLLSHIAMSVPRSQFNDQYLSHLSEFYGELLGWKVNDELSIDGDRLLMDLPGALGQYLNVKARDEPMSTTNYEHFGVYVDSPDEVRALHKKVTETANSEELECDEDVQVLYSGHLHTFRFKYLLPMAVEIQCIVR